MTLSASRAGLPRGVPAVAQDIRPKRSTNFANLSETYPKYMNSKPDARTDESDDVAFVAVDMPGEMDCFNLARRIREHAVGMDALLAPLWRKQQSSRQLVR